MAALIHTTPFSIQTTLPGLLHKVSIFLITFLILSELRAQCLEYPGTIYQSNDTLVSVSEISRNAAPMLWFSPDEPNLFDNRGKIRMPMALPVDQQAKRPVVYYKITYIYFDKRIRKSEFQYDPQSQIDLSKINGFDMTFYYYFDEESGLGNHQHDIESTSLQFSVLNDTSCTTAKYKIATSRVIAHAHGLRWYQNSFIVDDQTFFPSRLSLVKENMLPVRTKMPMACTHPVMMSPKISTMPGE